MAITISNLRIIPYSQKDQFKAIFGDELDFEFALPTPHQEGDKYALGLDFDKVVYPPSRPLCAYSTAFEVSGDVLKMTLALNTARFRDWVCRLKKPTPISMQLVRIRRGVADTLLLDDILALPSVVDGTNTVCPGDPLAELLDAKMDKPYAAGAPGQILSLDENGQNVWRDEQEIPEQEQADWDESDSSAVSYIKNKPVISEVGHTGQYGDLLNRPDLKPVATSGSYNDLTDKPHIPVDPVQADYDESDSTALDYIKNKPNLSVYSLVTETGNKIAMSIDEEYDLVVSLLDKDDNVLSTQDVDLPIESMIVDASYANGVLTLTLQNGHTVEVDISDIVSGLVPDSRKVNGHSLDADVTITASDLGLAAVATSGSYDDLLDKPHIPVDPVQADYDESDSDALDYIKNKPNLSVYVEKEAGKGLSTNNFTDAEKEKLGGIENGAQVNVNADWDESDSTDDSYIRHKPHLAAVATSGSYNDLTDRPAIPAAQVNSDWDESDSTDVAYIRNKPALAAVATSGSYNDLSNKPKIPYNTGDYLTIWNNSADNSAGSTVKLEKVGSPKDNTFQYRTSALSDNWQDYTLGTTLNIGRYNFVSFRNKNYAQNLTNGTNNDYYHFTITGNVWITGSVMSLKDCTDTYVGNVGASEFISLFMGNTATMDASQLKLPSANVTWQSYARMFKNCTGLTAAPEILPAMSLKSTGNYMEMFHGCTSLKNAPALPAMTLTDSCYKQMFYGCTSLVEAPALPATTIGNSSYYQMFYGCSSMNHVKASLADWNSANGGTSSWLSGVAASGVLECPEGLDTSTKGVSTVPAGWLVRRPDTRADFDESDSTEMSYIKNKPVIPAGGGSDSNDYLCFTAAQANSTVRLDKAGSAPVITLEYSTDRQTWANYTWTGSTGETITLAAIGDQVFLRGDNASMATSFSDYHYFVMSGKLAASGKTTSLIDKTCDRMDVPEYAYYKLFYGCTSLTNAPELPAYILNSACYGSLFHGCTSLIEAPELPATTAPGNCYVSMFRDCTSLKKTPELPATTIGQISYQRMFQGCTSLIEAPEMLPAMEMQSSCYQYMFNGCTSLTKAPELPATQAQTNCYQYMFQGCTSLVKAPSAIPFGDAYYASCQNMFDGCTALVKGPDLTANYVSDYCYENMFHGCTSLRYLKINKNHSSCNNILSGVAANGVLVAPDSINVSSWMPANWTKVDAANTPDNGTTSEVEASSGDTFAVCPGDGQTGVVTVSSSLTLTAMSYASTEIAYAEVVLDIAAGATVTAGTGLTLVDTPTAGKRNVCVVRWQGGAARMYIVDVMDIPA